MRIQGDWNWISVTVVRVSDRSETPGFVVAETDQTRTTAKNAYCTLALRLPAADGFTWEAFDYVEVNASTWADVKHGIPNAMGKPRQVWCMIRGHQYLLRLA